MKYILTFLLLVSYLISAQLEENSVLKYTKFKDQYEKNLIITKNTKEIIIADTNEEGRKIKEVMLNNKALKDDKTTVFLADLSLVPDFLMSLFMDEKFKEFKHKIGIIQKDEISDYFPQESGKITIIELENLKVKKIKFVENI